MFKCKNTGPLQVLKYSEMLEVVKLPAEEKANYIVAGYVNFESAQVVLYRGDGFTLEVDMDMFSSAVTQPDFNQFAIIDYGQTLQFGEFEASTDYVLYNTDPQYKLKADANRLTN